LNQENRIKERYSAYPRIFATYVADLWMLYKKIACCKHGNCLLFPPKEYESNFHCLRFGTMS